MNDCYGPHYLQTISTQTKYVMKLISADTLKCKQKMRQVLFKSFSV